MSAPPFADVKAVFFDLDDTLCQYWEAARAGLFRAFGKEGPEGFTAEQMVELWAKAFRGFLKEVTHPDWYSRYLKNGESTRTEQMRRTLAEAGMVDEERARRLSETYMRERNSLLRLFDDTREVLDLLKPRSPRTHHQRARRHRPRSKPSA